MTSIYGYSATAASNNAAAPDGAPENMAPSSVNDTIRKMMANLAEFAIAQVAGGTADALTLTPTNTLAAYVDGMQVHFRAAAANATTTPTLAISGLTARTIVKNGGSALVAGDIAGNLAEYIVRYNSANTRWELLNPGVGNIADASETVKGKVELATTAEAVTGTDTARAVTPAGVAAAAIYQGKHSIYIPASAMVAATTSGPASAQLEATTNKQNYKVLDFDATADEYAHFNIAFPKSWNESTITFQVVWSSTATDTDGVAWGLEAIAISDNEAVDTAWGTAVVVTDDAQSAAGEVYVTAESSAVTIGGTPAADDLVFFRFFRDVSDANDDMTEDARLIGVKIFYTVNSKDDT